MKKPQKKLKKWMGEGGRTKSGKPSRQTGEYAATTRAKKAGTAKGKQHVPQPKEIAKKTRRYRV